MWWRNFVLIKFINHRHNKMRTESRGLFKQWELLGFFEYCMPVHVKTCSHFPARNSYFNSSKVVSSNDRGEGETVVNSENKYPCEKRCRRPSIRIEEIVSQVKQLMSKTKEKIRDLALSNYFLFLLLKQRLF